ncbi:MAG: hypothetical protein JWO19_5122 [Bryobacterales bacterium]|jgi:hypothetical protein|nr:hypothetical protein [Bryobacterales bacterium]
MTRVAFVATTALAAIPLFAGVRIQMENTDLATNKTSTQQILLDSTRLRVDADANTSVMFLTDGGKNRMVMLDKKTNEYREMDEQMMNQLGQTMQGAMAQLETQLKNMPPEQRKMVEQMMKGKMPQAAQAPRTVYTAKGSGTVNGFSCTKYEGLQGAEKVAEVCAAQPAQIKITPSDFQVFEKMKQFTSGIQNAMANSPFGANLRSSMTEPGFEGFPVQRVTFRDGKAADRMELKSVTTAALSDADFSVGGAKKVDMPIPGGSQGKQR